jgi:hypothetical protein
MDELHRAQVAMNVVVAWLRLVVEILAEERLNETREMPKGPAPTAMVSTRSASSANLACRVRCTSKWRTRPVGFEASNAFASFLACHLGTGASNAM